MRKKIALFGFLYCILMSTFAGDIAAQKGPFYLALSAMTPDEAAYLFVVDQYMEVRCGRYQSIEHLKKLSTSESASIYVKMALKSGNLDKARAIVQAMPCE